MLSGPFLGTQLRAKKHAADPTWSCGRAEQGGDVRNTSAGRRALPPPASALSAASTQMSRTAKDARPGPAVGDCGTCRRRGLPAGCLPRRRAASTGVRGGGERCNGPAGLTGRHDLSQKGLWVVRAIRGRTECLNSLARDRSPRGHMQSMQQQEHHPVRTALLIAVTVTALLLGNCTGENRSDNCQHRRRRSQRERRRAASHGHRCARGGKERNRSGVPRTHRGGHRPHRQTPRRGHGVLVRGGRAGQLSGAEQSALDGHPVREPPDDTVGAGKANSRPHRTARRARSGRQPHHLVRGRRSGARTARGVSVRRRPDRSCSPGHRGKGRGSQPCCRTPA
jgi:hypothetical protein